MKLTQRAKEFTQESRDELLLQIGDDLVRLITRVRAMEYKMAELHKRFLKHENENWRHSPRW